MTTARKRALKLIGIILLGVFLGVTAFYAKRFLDFYAHIQTLQGKAGVVPTKVPEEKKVFNIVLMGYGGAGHDGPYLTDTIMVIHVDLAQKKTYLISIPRDLWVKIPTQSGDDFHSKINAVYQMGQFSDDYPDLAKQYKGKGAELEKHILQEVTGLSIDNYVAIDFTGFKKAIDILGGIDVSVERSFDDERYPIDGKEGDLCGVDANDKTKIDELEKVATESPQIAYPCRYEKLHFDAGLQHMDGTTALKYVRSRYSAQEGGDFSRGHRQQLFMQAVKDKVINIQFIPKVLPLMDELQDHIRTDVPLEVTKKFLGEAAFSGKYKITNYVLTTDNFLSNEYSTQSGYILVSDDGEDKWTSVNKGIKNLIGGKPVVTPSVEPKK